MGLVQSQLLTPLRCMEDKSDAWQSMTSAGPACRSCSLLCCAPLTGRTHQIRVHVAHMGHPIASDDLYGLKVSLACAWSMFLCASCCCSASRMGADSTSLSRQHIGRQVPALDLCRQRHMLPGTSSRCLCAFYEQDHRMTLIFIAVPMGGKTATACCEDEGHASENREFLGVECTLAV